MDTILDREILKEVDCLQQQKKFEASLDALKAYVEAGLKQGKFTRHQVECDVELALQVACADLKIDEYEAYWQAIHWLQRVKDWATDCGMWFYCYSVACLYTGQLEQALQLAEQSVLLLHNNGKAWLQLAKLRAHFGDKQAALQAVETGLQIQPDDTALQCIQQQILQNKDLEEMELALCGKEQEQGSQIKQVWGECQAKSRSILCILLRQENLNNIKCALQVQDWFFEEPYCFFTMRYQDSELDCRFDMNEAGVSKFSVEWLQAVFAHLPAFDEQAKQKVRCENQKLRLELEHFVIERNGCVKLGYHVGRSREERLFAYVRFDCNFSMQQDLSYEDYSENVTIEKSEQQTEEITERYTPAEYTQIQNHIERVFGSVAEVLQEPTCANIPVDLYVIAPTEQKNYYAIVTVGMGAHRMNVPDELKIYQIERAELVFYLPKDWKIHEQAPQWQWPLQELRRLARLPMEQKTWLGWGHTVPNGRPFAVNTDLSSVILTRPAEIPEQGAVCDLQDGSEVNFYQVVPLYNEELEYKLEHDAESLLQKMQEQGVLYPSYLQLQRPNAWGEISPLPLQEVELLEQIQQWHEQEQYQAIVQAIEQLPPEQRSYRLIGQQARALNNQNQYQQAIVLLESVKEKGASDPLWHFRLGYAYYYAGQEQKALDKFLRADELFPDDEYTQRFINWCKSAIALPVNIRPFRERVEEYWKAFTQKEEQLRDWMDAQLWDKVQQEQQQLLRIAFEDIGFEIRYENNCYELILVGESKVSRLLQCAYWQSKAPELLWQTWRFVVGEPPIASNWLTIEEESLDLEQIQTWVMPQENGRFGIELYGEQLVALQQQNAEKALRIMGSMIEKVLGEIPSVCFVAWVDVLEVPNQQSSQPITKLAQIIADKVTEGDVEALQDAELLLQNYQGYRYHPAETEEWILRQDVIVGSTCCSELARAYYQNDETWMNRHQQDGVICGFLFYSNEGIPEHELVELRGTLEDQLQQAGEDSVQILGGAIGIKYSYIDCMCFDLKAFLNAASDLLNQYPLEEIGFHVFRVDSGGVNLKIESE